MSVTNFQKNYDFFGHKNEMEQPFQHAGEILLDSQSVKLSSIETTAVYCFYIFTTFASSASTK